MAPPFAKISSTSMHANVVQLPQVNVIGLQQLQRLLDHAQRPREYVLWSSSRETYRPGAAHYLPDVRSLQRSGPP